MVWLICWMSIKILFQLLKCTRCSIIFPRRPFLRLSGSPLGQMPPSPLSSWVHLHLSPCWIPSWICFLNFFLVYYLISFNGYFQWEPGMALSPQNKGTVGICLLLSFVLCCVLLLPSLVHALHDFRSQHMFEGRLAVLVSSVGIPAQIKISPVFNSSSSCGFCLGQSRILSGLADAPREGCLPIPSSPVNFSSFSGHGVLFVCP